MSDNARQLFAIVWVLLALAAAATMSAGYGPRIQLPDSLHLVAHGLLFGVLGLVLARAVGSVHLAFGLTLLAGAGVEFAQGIGLTIEGVELPRLLRLLIPEASFDMTVNAVAGMSGIALSGRRGAAEAIGSWLHPVVIGPIAVMGLGWAARGEGFSTLFWTVVMLLCFAPAVIAWTAGVWGGHYGDIDLRDRSQRPLLFLVACACAAVFAGLTTAIADPPFPSLGLLLFASAVAVTSITTAGLKISGHVSAPLVLAVCLLPFSLRGTGVLVVAAVLLSWARVRARCHAPHEVAAAWMLGAALLATAWVFGAGGMSAS